jgi:hypothetical protein
MTPLNLITSLADELREATKKYKFPAQYQEPKNVSVYVQAVPTEEFENQSFYPLICVEFLSNEVDVDISVASVLITVGTYNNETTKGVIDHLNLLEEIAQYLVLHPIIGKKFSAILPLYMGMVEKRSEEFTYSNIFLQYQVARPNKSFVDDFLFKKE